MTGVWRRENRVGHFFEGHEEVAAAACRGEQHVAACGRLVTVGMWVPKYLERCVDCAQKVRKARKGARS